MRERSLLTGHFAMNFFPIDMAFRYTVGILELFSSWLLRSVINIRIAVLFQNPFALAWITTNFISFESSSFFKDGIVPEVSWPLSRFAKGKNEVTISFAVKGAADNLAVSEILFYVAFYCYLLVGKSVTKGRNNWFVWIYIKSVATSGIWKTY